MNRAAFQRRLALVVEQSEQTAMTLSTLPKVILNLWV